MVHHAVVGIIVNPAGKVLLLLRSKRQKFYPGKWGFVGGHLEPGEEPDKAIIREINEELAVHARIVEKGKEYQVKDHDDTWNVYPYLCKTTQRIRIANFEHDRMVWVSPEEIIEYDLAAPFRGALEAIGLTSS
jgi:8-oxo-dGTP diphosphatase